MEDSRFWVPTQSAEDPHRFELRVSPAACVGPPDRQFLMGGVGMGAAIEALESFTKRPLIWATSQFLSGAALDARVGIDVETLVAGKSVTLASATLREGDRIVHMVSAALGRREGWPTRQFARMPEVAAPEECEVKAQNDFAQPGNLLDVFEKRLAYQNDETGSEHLWLGTAKNLPMSAGLLAIIADFLPGGHSAIQGGTSLDNTFRLHCVRPTRWVLNETQFSGISSGVFHGSMNLFAEDGTLLAIASQTGLPPRRVAEGVWTRSRNAGGPT